MPATIIEDPLGIDCVFSDGTTARFDLDGLPNPALARDLLLGLVELIHPHGTMDAAGSVGNYVQAIRNMTRTLAGQGFTGRATDLRRGQLAEYWIGSTGPREASTRRMLQAFHAVTSELAADVAEFAAGRAFNPQRSNRQMPPYSEAEWDRLVRTCRTIVDESYAAHQQALAAAERGQHPSIGGWTPANLRWLLARLGPVSTADFSAEVGCTKGTVQRRGGFAQASAEMFPSLDTLIGYRLLFGAYSGVVPDGIDDLGVDDIDWAGDATILLSYLKRRTATESVNLPRRAVRLLEQWLSHSALLRSFADEQQRRRLWSGLSWPGHCVDVSGLSARTSIKRWVIRHGVKNDDGGRLKIHRSRIRTTHHAMRDTKTWAGRGRATIDPNHSPHIEGDHYLSAPTESQRQAVEAIVEDAQHDLMRRAHPPVVITDEKAAALARDYPQLISTLNIDDTVIAELVGGTRDVFVAACADQLSGLHGPKGKPCPARPWVCLLCPLAVFAPRHAPNPLRLKAFFARQWRQLPTAQFMAIFGPYSQRISQVLDRFDTAVLATASSHVTDRDAEMPLRPEETTE